MNLEFYRSKTSPTPCHQCAEFRQPESGWWCGRGGRLRRFRWNHQARRIVATNAPCPCYQGQEVDHPRIHPQPKADYWRPYAD